MPKKFFTYIVGLSLLVTSGLAGCSSNNKKEQIDPPKTVKYESTESDYAEGVTDVINTELYLLDKDNLLVPTSFALPNTQSVAKQALEHLVKDGPITNLIPDGFQAILPAETVINSMDVQDEIAIVDFSEEFANYEVENEEKILQAIVWTLTQFESINGVTFRINGKELTNMPAGNYNIAKPLDKSIGINTESSLNYDVMNSKQITLYFEKSKDESSYFVPVTRRIAKDSPNLVTTIVEELSKGPQAGNSLSTDFSQGVTTINSPKIEDGVAFLDFDNSVCSTFDDNEKIISEQLVSQLVLSLTEQDNISRVNITVNGNSELIDESGNKLITPVARPAIVNTETY